jgi:hypothetical protein
LFRQRRECAKIKNYQEEKQYVQLAPKYFIFYPLGVDMILLFMKFDGSYLVFIISLSTRGLFV